MNTIKQIVLFYIWITYSKLFLMTKHVLLILSTLSIFTDKLPFHPVYVVYIIAFSLFNAVFSYYMIYTNIDDDSVMSWFNKSDVEKFRKQIKEIKSMDK